MVATMLQLAGEAALYSCLASSGFVIAVLVAWLILSRLAPGSRPVGNFGKFMIVLESLDSIPEAMVIASATASERMTLAFAFSIFSLNLANTTATALDFLATKPEKVLHRLLLAMIFFSVGSLSFSISSTVFSAFLEHLASGEYTWLNLIPMLGGVCIGALLIWLLLVVEERLHEKEQAKNSPQNEDIMIEEDVLGPLRRTLEREEHHLRSARESQYDSEEYRASVVAYYENRVSKVRALIASMESVASLRESLALPITQDAREVVEDSIYDQLGSLEHTYLLAPRAPQGESLNRRALRLLAIMSALVCWAVLLTFSFTPLFIYLDQGTFSSYVNSFAEGLSGGAFLATISSTMIPRIQQDAYRSHWSRLAFRSVGMLAFISGLVFAVLLETIAIKAPNSVHIGLYFMQQEMQNIQDSPNEEAEPLLQKQKEEELTVVVPVPEKSRGNRAVRALASPILSFWDFLVNGNFVQLAVAFIVGGAFNKAIQSLVDDIIMPPIGALVGSANFVNLFGVILSPSGNKTYSSLAAAQADGAVTENYGKFLLALFNFFVVSIVMYFVVKAGAVTATRTKLLKKQLLKASDSTKECQFCFNSIDVRAKKCGFCCENVVMK